MIGVGSIGAGSIGAGSIGAGAPAELLAHPAVQGVPVVVETPSEDGGHAHDIALPSALRDGVAAGQLAGVG
jgi:deoxyribonuclease-4